MYTIVHRQIIRTHALISYAVVLLYTNHRLRNIMSGPNLAETKHEYIIAQFL